jgi:hypothetical protein
MSPPLKDFDGPFSLFFLIFHKKKREMFYMNNLLKSSKRFLKRNSSTILTFVGAGGVIVTSVTAVKATPKALSLLDKAEEEKGETLTKLEIVQVAGPAYIPSVLIGVSTMACIFGANYLNKRKQAALISAYAVLDNSYKEYRKKVEELHGKEAEQEIRNEIAKDHYDEDLEEDDGKQLFYDPYSNRYFRATNETVLMAEYKINKMLSEDCYVSLNELYELLEIPTVDYGEFVGWSSAQMFEMYWSSWINFYHEKVEMEDGLECFIINYTEPNVDFENY